MIKYLLDTHILIWALSFPEKLSDSVREALTNRKNKVFYALLVKTLSANNSHKDPFDRMLIAQAKAEHMILLSHDGLIGKYNEACIRIV